jgi:hypothetical protein
VKIGDFGLAIKLNEKDHEGNFPIEGFTTWYKPPEVEYIHLRSYLVAETTTPHLTYGGLVVFSGRC